MAVNCSALAEGILESELFGHVKGAFTGANVARPGLFREADGGTLFLDEIGDISPALQSRLLRALQEHEIVPVGAETPVSVDARIIAATHRDLPQLVKDGRFREDLYYRLHVVSLTLPPLRSRRQDLPLLIDDLLRGLAERHDRGPVAVDPEAQALLLCVRLARQRARAAQRARARPGAGVTGRDRTGAPAGGNTPAGCRARRECRDATGRGRTPPCCCRSRTWNVTTCCACCAPPRETVSAPPACSAFPAAPSPACSSAGAPTCPPNSGDILSRQARLSLTLCPSSRFPPYSRIREFDHGPQQRITRCAWELCAIAWCRAVRPRLVASPML